MSLSVSLCFILFTAHQSQTAPRLKFGSECIPCDQQHDPPIKSKICMFVVKIATNFRTYFGAYLPEEGPSFKTRKRTKYSGNICHMREVVLLTDTERRLPGKSPSRICKPLGSDSSSALKRKKGVREPSSSLLAWKFANLAFFGLSRSQNDLMSGTGKLNVSLWHADCLEKAPSRLRICLGQKSCRTKHLEFFEFSSRILPRILL